MTRLRDVTVAVLLCAVMPACALTAHSTVADGGPAPQMSELWAEADTARDTTGKSPGYDVRDAQGRLWSVKLGPEAQPEVVVSRLLWAAGYFQPATYYLPSWTLVGTSDRTAQPAGRFRLQSDGEEKVGSWSWSANPFVGTTPLRGLFVLMVIVNNWDLKTQQNKVYELTGASDRPLRRYVVRDLGASLGSTRWFFAGSKSNIDDFEQERFIHSVHEGRVRFHYRGAWREPHLKRGVTLEDVRWISERLARLTPEQWTDAFRAGGYDAAESGRYVVRLQAKVAEGLDVDRRAVQ